MAVAPGSGRSLPLAVEFVLSELLFAGPLHLGRSRLWPCYPLLFHSSAFWSRQVCQSLPFTGQSAPGEACSSRLQD